MIGALLIWSHLGWAGSPSGLGLPFLGGAMSSPTHSGATGLVVNPAAAFSKHVEILLNAQMVGYTYEYTLNEPFDGGPPEGAKNGAVFPAPYLAAVVPVSDRVGLGISAKVPYARTGSGEADAAGRFHTVSGQMLMGEMEAAMAVEVHKSLVIGAGFRLGQVRYSSFKAIDTGTMMYGLLGEPAEALIGDPLLEGTKEVTGGRGTSKAFSIGVVADLPGEIRIAGGWRTPSVVHIQGNVEMVPSNDLQMSLSGNLAGDFTFPAELFLAVQTPPGPIVAGADLGWIGWSRTSEIPITVENPTLAADDPTLSELMALYGLDDPTLISDLQSVTKSGMQDIVTGGAWVKGRLRDGFHASAGAWVSPPSVTAPYVHPGNADYWMVDLRSALYWTPRGKTSYGISGDWLASKKRVIRNSGLDPKNTDPLGPGALPSGNGEYDLNMAGLGISVLFQI